MALGASREGFKQPDLKIGPQYRKQREFCGLRKEEQCPGPAVQIPNPAKPPGLPGRHILQHIQAEPAGMSPRRGRMRKK